MRGADSQAGAMLEYINTSVEVSLLVVAVWAAYRYKSANLHGTSLKLRSQAADEIRSWLREIDDAILGLNRLSDVQEGNTAVRRFLDLIEVDRAASAWPILSTETRRRFQKYTDEMRLTIEGARLAMANDVDAVHSPPGILEELLTLASIDAVGLNERRWREHNAAIGASLFADETKPSLAGLTMTAVRPSSDFLRTPLRGLGYPDSGER